jgi:Flp pilus assembly protein TadD
MYGMNLYERGNRAEGFSEIAIAMALYPPTASLLSDAGDLYRTDGQCEVSIAFYNQALAIAPDLKYTRSRLASCYMRTGRFAEARAELRHLVADGHPEFGDLIHAVDSAAAASGKFQ